MIVISGALVLVAAVLLVFGIVWSIPLVYAAIVLSIVSAIFLLISVFQRPPQDPATALSPTGGPLKDVRDAEPEDASGSDPVDFPREREHPDFELRAGNAGADVLVVSGRPRYHVDGCSYVQEPAEAGRWRSTKPASSASPRAVNAGLTRPWPADCLTYPPASRSHTVSPRSSSRCGATETCG